MAPALIVSGSVKRPFDHCLDVLSGSLLRKEPGNAKIDNKDGTKEGVFLRESDGFLKGPRTSLHHIFHMNHSHDHRRHDTRVSTFFPRL